MEMSEAWPAIYDEGYGWNWYIYIFIQQQTDTTTWSKLPNGKKAIVKQILVSEEREKFSRPGLWESQSGIKVTV